MSLNREIRDKTKIDPQGNYGSTTLYKSFVFKAQDQGDLTILSDLEKIPDKIVASAGKFY